VQFEISERCGLARLGSLDIDGSKFRTPLLAFVDTGRFPAPYGSPRIRMAADRSRGDISVARSGFAPERSPADERAHLKPGFRGSPFASSARQSDDFMVVDDTAGTFLDSGRFVDWLSQAKSGPDLLRPFYCSVMGLPHRLAFLAYCGFDVFDSIPLIMATENGTYLTSSGQLAYDSIEELPCSCPACTSGRRSREELLQHNYAAAQNELRLIRHEISQETLRDLVEARIRSDPWLIQNLRLMDLERYDLQESHTPVKGARFHAGAKESLTRPEVTRWRKRIVERFRKPSSARVLLLIPCSAKKPYSISQSHIRFRKAIWASGKADIVHEVIVTSPLGIVPRELELFYPAQDYDIPVTGHWDRDEKAMVEELVSWLVSAQGYDLVISHLGDEREPVNSVLKDFVDTSMGSPGSKESLNRLEQELKAYGAQGNSRERFLDDMRSLCRFQLGPAGERLCDGARIAGRWPNLKIIRGDTQLAMLTGDRGMLSLTLDGGKVLAESGKYCVEIEDFVPKGNLFAVGVERASSEIRIGDDVVVAHSGEARAVGVAKMTPQEMELAERGEAVHIRHVAE